MEVVREWVGNWGGKRENHSVTKPLLAEAEYRVLTEVQTPVFIYHFCN